MKVTSVVVDEGIHVFSMPVGFLPILRRNRSELSSVQRSELQPDSGELTRIREYGVVCDVSGYNSSGSMTAIFGDII